MRVWDAERGEELAVLRGHEKWLNNVAYSPDGRRIVSASGDSSVRVWDAESTKCLEVIHGQRDVCTIVAGLPFRAIGHGVETVIETSVKGISTAWFP